MDAARVVVLGGSYGGYMALAAATVTPSEFAANVDYFGVSDLKSLVESSLLIGRRARLTSTRSSAIPRTRMTRSISSIGLPPISWRRSSAHCWSFRETKMHG